MAKFSLILAVVVFSFLNITPAYALGSPVDLEASEAKNEELAAALDRMKEKNPKRYLRMLEARSKNPSQYEKMESQALSEFRRIRKLQRLVPENVSLQEDIWKNRTRLTELMRNLRTAKEGAGRVILESQVEKVLEEQFDLRLRMKRNRLVRAEKVVAKRMDALNSRQARKKEVVMRWRDRLLARLEPVGDEMMSKNAAPKRRARRPKSAEPRRR